MSETKTDSQEETIKIVRFDGTQPEKWREWKIKTKAIATRKKWEKAIEEDLSKSTETEDKRKNDDAWNHLVLACSGEAFDIITAVDESENGNAYVAWGALMSEYEPRNQDAVVEVEAEFAACKLESENENPKLWIS